MRKPETHEIIVGVIAASAIAVVAYAAGVPTKLAVQEQRITTIENRFDKVDSKLDRILERLGRR